MYMILAPLDWVRRRLRGWWREGNALRQLAQCDDRDLERIAQDLSITRSELAKAMRCEPNAKLLLPEMLKALDLSHDRLKAEYPRVEADLNRVCSQCSETKRCRRELDAHTAPVGYHEFCGNASTLKALVAEAAAQVNRREEDKPPTPGQRV